MPYVSECEFVHDLLDGAALRNPTATALSDASGDWTYADLRAASLRMARGLWQRGVRGGQRVLTQMPNRKELVALLYGASRVGAVLVPVTPEMKPFHLRSVLADTTPALVVTDGAHSERIAALNPAPIADIDDVWHDGRTAPAPPDGTGPRTSHDAALLIHTSGSTSVPKGVVCPHRQTVFAARSIDRVLRYRADDVVFLRLPLSFDYGLHQLFLAALSGARVVLAEAGSDLTLLRRLRDAGATVVPVVPALAQLLTHLATRDPGPTAVRLFTNTGAALTEPTGKALRVAFPSARVALMFGTTECKRVSILEPDGDLTRPGSVGRPIPGTAVDVVDEDGKPLPTGSEGEFVVRGPHVMAGYWNAPELTERRFRKDPRTGETVLHTGDHGHLDEDGHLYFSGRRDDIVKHRGTRVSVLEIEAAALDVPGVRAAAVVALGEDALALCVVADTAGTGPVVEGLAERLEQAKLPDQCLRFDALPLTPNGKTDYHRLSETVRETQQ
ncbi:AMP-binding protein [Streptomyces sp. NBC_00250]|uniref:class I adenylate-forming enzyme family protein n=1 Tax=Streptomyces sp. NBC_00250 TaxID=2903641 RepID=UPI002E28F482|nr:AMP-binding protein [Streptomyces sp. NBC_00250]